MSLEMTAPVPPAAQPSVPGGAPAFFQKAGRWFSLLRRKIDARLGLSKGAKHVGAFLWTFWKFVVSPFGLAKPPKAEFAKKDFADALKSIGSGDTDWLKDLYKYRADAFKTENDRIWEIGRILLPISLGTFGVLGGIRRPSTLQVVLLASTSVGLLWVWNAVADGHRSFQQVHRTWMDEIEQAIGVEKRPEGEKGIKFQTVRRGLLAVVLVAWGLLGLRIHAQADRDSTPARLARDTYARF